MTETKKSNPRPSVLSYDDVRAVSPALEHYTKGPKDHSLTVYGSARKCPRETAAL
jgi:hypothetical protein